MPDAADGLTAYLVGGAVRDRLLGLRVTDRDWVVVGVTPAEMLRRGFRAAGADFPVFLHPQSGEQYALARRERKTARGYKGFDIISDPGITLEQDLERRDLTINAIAVDARGNLIDPFGGRGDIEKRILRHISPAFAEDPVRVLRTARFRAKFDALGFRVHADTQKLMAHMVRDGEVDALQPERVWAELQRALSTPAAAQFIKALRACGALQKILPEVNALFGVPQPREHHPEVDSGVHVLLALDAAQKLSNDARVAFAVLMHDLGKAVTAKSKLPKHHGHERAGLPLVDAVCARLRVPEKYRALAKLVCEFHLHHHRMLELKPTTVLNMLEKLDAFRRAENVELFCTACAADLRGRGGHENVCCEQGDLLRAYFRAAADVDAGAVAAGVGAHASGGKIKTAVRRARIAAIAAVKTTRAKH